MGIDDRTEWLEADGLGGFASGTTAGIRTRRYHALLLTAIDAAHGQSGAGERLRRLGRYGGRIVCALDPALCAGRAPSGRRVSHHRLRRRSLADLAIRGGRRHSRDARSSSSSTAPAPWSSSGRWCGAKGPVVLARQAVPVRVATITAMHHENGAFRFEAAQNEALVTVLVVPRLPDVVSLSNGDYRHGARLVPSTFCTPPSASAAWTTPRISRRRASSAGRLPRLANRRCGS